MFFVYNNTRRTDMAYHRLAETERILIYQHRQDGLGNNAIARLLKRSSGAISREVSRNTGLRGYRPQQAQALADARSTRPGYRCLTPDMEAEIVSGLTGGWTPAIIAGRAKLEGRPMVCKERIYLYTYANGKAGGTLWTYLPRAKRKRHRRCPRVDGRGRGRIPNQRSIDTRPAEVENRKRAGHWEADLINGANGTGNLVTLVERTTRFLLIGRTESKNAVEVTAEICRLFESVPQYPCYTVTFDNGKEFAGHEKMEKRLGAGMFFAHPYHSWERGTNENTNGLVRRVHPKRSSFADIGDAELYRIDTFINDRPRKCLGWMTPREKMAICAVLRL